MCSKEKNRLVMAQISADFKILGFIDVSSTHKFLNTYDFLSLEIS